VGRIFFSQEFGLLKVQNIVLRSESTKLCCEFISVLRIIGKGSGVVRNNGKARYVVGERKGEWGYVGLAVNFTLEKAGNEGLRGVRGGRSDGDLALLVRRGRIFIGGGD
jgi:hypothetical protein